MGQALDRRKLIRNSGLMGVGVLGAGMARASSCGGLTPTQPEGPFYPITLPTDQDVDLTQVEGHAEKALGQPILVKGQVTNLSCAPLAGAIVEIWQACASGRYNHPQDTNSAPLDPHFQYWGRAQTNASGEYGFRSVKPGAYPASPSWIRPPHLHVKVIAEGFPTLITQLYFAEEGVLNDADLILQRLTPAQRERVIVRFVETSEGVLEGRFDIALGMPGAPDATPELD